MGVLHMLGAAVLLAGAAGDLDFDGTAATASPTRPDVLVLRNGQPTPARGDFHLRVRDRVTRQDMTYGDQAQFSATVNVGKDVYGVELLSAGFPPAPALKPEPGKPQQGAAPANEASNQASNETPQAPDIGAEGGVMLDRDVFATTAVGPQALPRAHAAIVVQGVARVLRNGKAIAERAPVQIFALSSGVLDDQTHAMRDSAAPQDVELHLRSPALDAANGGPTAMVWEDVSISVGDQRVAAVSYVPEPGAAQGVGGAGVPVSGVNTYGFVAGSPGPGGPTSPVVGTGGAGTGAAGSARGPGGASAASGGMGAPSEGTGGGAMAGTGGGGMAGGPVAGRDVTGGAGVVTGAPGVNAPSAPIQPSPDWMSAGEAANLTSIFPAPGLLNPPYGYGLGGGVMYGGLIGSTLTANVAAIPGAATTGATIPGTTTPTTGTGGSGTAGSTAVGTSLNPPTANTVGTTMIGSSNVSGATANGSPASAFAVVGSPAGTSTGTFNTTTNTFNGSAFTGTNVNGANITGLPVSAVTTTTNANVLNSAGANAASVGTVTPITPGTTGSVTGNQFSASGLPSTPTPLNATAATPFIGTPAPANSQPPAALPSVNPTVAPTTTATTGTTTIAPTPVGGAVAPRAATPSGAVAPVHR